MSDEAKTKAEEIEANIDRNQGDIRQAGYRVREYADARLDANRFKSADDFHAGDPRAMLQAARHKLAAAEALIADGETPDKVLGLVADAQNYGILAFATYEHQYIQARAAK